MNSPSKRKEMMNRLLKDQVVKTVLTMIQEGTPITMDKVNVFNFQKEHPLYFKYIQSHRSAAAAVTDRMDAVIIPLVHVCREGMRLGQFKDVDPYVMAAMIFGTLVGPLESLTYREEPLMDGKNV
ncbi:hypothetical protein [Desulfobacter latus]|uniref:Uncharacterized protein n=1 Tax=Desulfobacter latus TaxID=2292 RepID=A0A850TH72_9BACT|nr:hypothetical protein [Desulfobacter latus]NWH06956.1 hypothetical protein [Desulfobacter latus]